MTLCQYSPCLCEWRVIFQIVLWGNLVSFALSLRVIFNLACGVEPEPRHNESCCYSPAALLPEQPAAPPGAETRPPLLKGAISEDFTAPWLTDWDTIYLLGSPAALTLSGLKRVLGAHFMTHPKQPNTEEEKVHQPEPEFVYEGKPFTYIHSSASCCRGGCSH